MLSCFFNADRPDTDVENATVDTPPLEGLSYTLKCGISEAGKPEEILQYAWQKDGEDITGENGELLTIEMLRKEDGGTYRCAAQNVPGMGEFGDPLNVTVWCKYY